MSDESSRPTTHREYLSDPQTVLVLLITFGGMYGAILPPALPGIATELSVADSQVGLLITAFKIPSIVVIPIAAIVADTYGRRSVLLPSLVIFGLAGTVMVVIDDFTALLTAALVLGVGGAAVLPVTVTLIGDIFSGTANTTVQGLRVGIVGLATITLPAATGYLSGLSSNYPFLLFGTLLPLAVISSRYLKEPTDLAPAEFKRSTPMRQRAIDRLRTYGQTLRVELDDRNLGLLFVGGFTRGFVRYALVTFVPLFAVRVLGASLFEAGVLLSLQGVAYVFVSPLAGRVVSQITRKWALGGSFLLCAGSLVSIPLAPSVMSLGGLVITYTIGDAIFDPVMKDAVTSLSRPEYRAGVVNGLYVFKRVAQTLSPAAFGGVLVLAGFSELFVLAGLIAAAYVIVFSTWFTYDPVDVPSTTG